jgi:hypothetical protein
MSKHRFTIKELDEFSDKQILLMLIGERLSELQPYSILGERLEKIAKRLREAV